MGILFELTLARDVQAPKATREAIADWFADLAEAVDLETATLLVSELVTNAIRHGRGTVTIRADLDDDRLLVEVIDEGGGLEHVIRTRPFEKVEGWGLRIVDSESSRWGAHEGTTHVWFELERPGPRLGSDKNPASDDG
jgi:anti-sigma regulatory factor (Ser/Thr protein kinase)